MSVEKRHQARALQVYKLVLKNDNRNIWAANGVGCVLAHKGYLNEARDIFAQVREATADMPDVWLNIAHIYVEQKQYIPAVQMYENCLKKFYKHNNVEVLTYLARALVKGNRLHEAHNALLNARRVAPHDLTLMYNIALVQQKLAQEILKDENSTLNCVLQAIDRLRIAQKTFTWLGEHGDSHRLDLNQALQEARQCSDLLSQSTYHEIRARKKDEEEQLVRRKQDEERRKLREKQLQEAEERRRLDDERRQVEREKRQQFVERTKNLLTTTESQVASEKSQRSTGGTKRRSKRDDEDEFINDTSDLITNTDKAKRKRAKKLHDVEDRHERKSSKKRKVPVRSDNENDDIEARKRKKKSNNRKRLSRVRIQNDEESQDNEEQLSDNEPNDNESSSDEKLKRRLTPRKSTSQSKRSSSSRTTQRHVEPTNRYKSKATISSSEDDSDNELSHPTIPTGDEEEEEEEEVEDTNQE